VPSEEYIQVTDLAITHDSRDRVSVYMTRSVTCSWAGALALSCEKNIDKNQLFTSNVRDGANVVDCMWIWGTLASQELLCLTGVGSPLQNALDETRGKLGWLRKLTEMNRMSYELV
jgi:hypothetical protein